jgi:hypothetical protein
VVHNSRINGYLVFWCAFLVIFAAVGVRGLVTTQHAPAIEGTGPYGSSNGLLRVFVGFHGGSEKILEICKSIPVAQPSVVFWPEKNNNTSFCYLMISYLAWPRRVEGMAINQEQLAPAVDRLREKSNGGIWLYGLAPTPNLKHGIVVDRGLLFIPAEQ